MLEFAKFVYCPKCASKNIEQDSQKSMVCTDCGFVYFHNNSSAVGALIEKDSKLLLCLRKFNPKKGMLDIPGGFVDYGESLEEALARELREELNLNVLKMSYFCSSSNIYDYKDVRYLISDVFFRCEVKDFLPLQVGDDVESIIWMDIDKINLDNMAFKSGKEVIEKFLSM